VSKTSNNSSQHASTLLIENVGQNNIDHIMATLGTVPWGVTFLKLAWTAGPLTFIALQGGYLLGYGSPASYNLFIYFAGYTLITGITSLATSIFSASKNEKKKKTAMKNLNYTVDKIFDYIESCKDIQFKSISSQEQKYAMAYRILQNSYALPDAIAIAILDVSNSKALANIGKKMEIFRRANLRPRINELTECIQEERIALVDEFSVSHPRLAALIDNRLQGKSTSLKTGLPRTIGFLERIFSAAETGRLAQMSIRDAEEFLTLIFELLNDRGIEVLRFQFSGKKPMADLTYKLERTRALCQLAKSNLNYRVQVLFAYLVDNDIIQYEDEEGAQELIYSIFQAINTLAENLMTPKESKELFNEQANIFLKSLSLYNSILSAQKKLIEKEKEYNKLFISWRKMTAKSKKRTRLKHGRGKKGLRIIDYTLHLNDQEKIEFVNAIAPLLSEFDNRIKKHPARKEVLLKKLIIFLAIKTNEFIDISDPINRIEIETSNATNLSSIEHNYSVKAKMGLATALTNEVCADHSKSSENLARVFVQHYGETLQDDTIEFFCKNYNADPKRLKKIQTNDSLINLASLEGQSLSVRAVPHVWKQTKETVQHKLKKAH